MVDVNGYVAPMATGECHCTLSPPAGCSTRASRREEVSSQTDDRRGGFDLLSRIHRCDRTMQPCSLMRLHRNCRQHNGGVWSTATAAIDGVLSVASGMPGSGHCRHQAGWRPTHFGDVRRDIQWKDYRRCHLEERGEQRRQAPFARILLDCHCDSTLRVVRADGDHDRH